MTRQPAVAATVYIPTARTRIRARSPPWPFSSPCWSCAWPRTTFILRRREPNEQHTRELFHRHKLNPILTAANWPYPVNTVFNPGATLLADGTTLLLCRVEDRRGQSHLCAARSANGVDGWQIDPQPTLLPDPEHYPEEIWGIEDPRITYVPELESVCHCLHGLHSRWPGRGSGATEDFHLFERYGMIMPPEDKDATLLAAPHRGRWALIHRPVSSPRAHMWISYSPDLSHWGSHALMLEARRGGWWDANKIGLSPPPIETPEGWLMIYHGVRQRRPALSID